MEVFYLTEGGCLHAAQPVGGPSIRYGLFREQAVGQGLEITCESVPLTPWWYIVRYVRRWVGR